MTDEQKDLLMSKESLEPSRVWIIVGTENRCSIPPDDLFRAGEQILKKRVLGAHFNVHMARAKARNPTSLVDTVDFRNCSLGVGFSLELNVAVHRFGGRSFHDNVDCATLSGCYHVGVPADEVNDFLLGDGVWNLCFFLLTRDREIAISA